MTRFPVDARPAPPSLDGDDLYCSFKSSAFIFVQACFKVTSRAIWPQQLHELGVMLDLFVVVPLNRALAGYSALASARALRGPALC